MADADWLGTDLKYPDRTGEVYRVAFNPEHRWFYVPNLQPDEILLLKTFDSAKDGRAHYMPHTAFADPATVPGTEKRQSIECGCWRSGNVAKRPAPSRHAKAWPWHPRVSMGHTHRMQANSWTPRPSLGVTEWVCQRSDYPPLYADRPLERRPGHALAAAGGNDDIRALAFLGVRHLALLDAVELRGTHAGAGEHALQLHGARR